MTSQKLQKPKSIFQISRIKLDPKKRLEINPQKTLKILTIEKMLRNYTQTDPSHDETRGEL
jgi:hypothetical protein